MRSESQGRRGEWKKENFLCKNIVLGKWAGKGGVAPHKGKPRVVGGAAWGGADRLYGPIEHITHVGAGAGPLALWQESLSGRGKYLKRPGREWRGWAGRPRTRDSDTRRASGPLPSAACGWDSATPASPCCSRCGRWWPLWFPAPAVLRCPAPVRAAPAPPARANTPEHRAVPCPHEELQWRLSGRAAGGGAGVQLVRMGAGCLLLPSLTTAPWGAAQPTSPHT